MQTAYKRGSRGRKRNRKRKKKKRREEKKAAAARVCVCLCCRLRATANTLHIRSRQTLLLHQKMPQYDDREGSAKLYVGRLSSRTRSRDLEDLFRKYGRVREVDMKHDFAFIEFSDRRDADDARHYLNGKDVDGSRIIVEFARRGPRGPGAVREYDGRGPPGTGRCYNCGNEGHWARDCKAGDWKDKCYRCGQRGHIERNCRNSPRPSSRSRLSRSLSRSPSRGRSRSRSYSRSPKRDNRSPLKDNRAHSLSASPGRGDVQSRSLSPVADVRSPRLSPLPRDTSRSISGSPRKRSVTPLSGAENGSQ